MITTLPTVPSRIRPATFASEADVFLSALQGFATEANALLVQCNLNATTSLSIGEIVCSDAVALDGISSLLAVTPHGLKTVTSVICPVGLIAFWPTSTPPTGWLVRDGSAISRTSYAALFAVLGTAYGVGDGSTTFNLPDDRGRVLAGYKSGDANFGTFGGVLGAATHTLDTTQIPSHTHSQELSSGSGYFTNGGPPNHAFGGSQTGATGGGLAHNNVQPTRVYLPIIKY